MRFPAPMLCARPGCTSCARRDIRTSRKESLLNRIRLLGVAHRGGRIGWRYGDRWLASASAAGLTGAGSTLVAPLMANWINGFEIKEGIPVKYGAVGSGAGIAQITARTVDFGASDAPLTPRTGRRLQRLRADPLGPLGHGPRLQHPGREETQPHRARSSPGSTSARSPTGTTRRSRRSTRRRSCRTWRSPRSSAATAPVTPTRSPTTSRRSARLEERSRLRDHGRLQSRRRCQRQLGHHRHGRRKPRVRSATSRPPT